MKAVKKQVKAGRSRNVTKGQDKLDGGSPHAFAPKGYYMLFTLNNDKVPSVAEWIYLDQKIRLINRNKNHCRCASINTCKIYPGREQPGVHANGDCVPS